tara:strand:- start:70 stop:1941 length:1872 start_codon:yes stop_codon:yes gene_type:complete
MFQPTLSADGGDTYFALDSSILSSIKGLPLSTTDEQSIVISADTLLANDTDADGDTLSISSISNVQDGYAYLNSDGNVVFIATAGFSGTATFDYTITDGKGGYDTATASVEVTASAILPTVTVTLSDGVENTVSEEPELWAGFSNDDVYQNISGDFTSSSQATFTDVGDNIKISGSVKQYTKTLDGDDQVQVTNDLESGIELGAGDDKLIVNGTANAKIDAGSGNDEIQIGEDSSGWVSLGDGNDSLYVEETVRHSIDAGSGNDTVVIGGDVKAHINLGSGDDLLVIGGVVEWNLDSGEGNDSLLLAGYTNATYEAARLNNASFWDYNIINDFENILLGDGTLIQGDRSVFENYLSQTDVDTDIDTDVGTSTFTYAVSVDVDSSHSTVGTFVINLGLVGIPTDISAGLELEVELDGVPISANNGIYSIEVDGSTTSLDNLTITSNVELPDLEITSTVTNKIDDSGLDDIIVTDSYLEGTDSSIADTLLGDLGDDVLFGGDDETTDILIGLEGKDIFILGDTADSSNIDTITDFNAAEDALDLTDLLTGIEGSPGKDADMDLITEFLSQHVKVTDGNVKVDGEDVATFIEERSSFDSNNDGLVNSSDSIKVIYNNEEYSINIDG